MRNPRRESKEALKIASVVAALYIALIGIGIYILHLL